MSSTNKTSLGLNLWEASDKPVRQDFVNDNTIIDEKITKINSNLDDVNSKLNDLNINLASALSAVDTSRFRFDSWTVNSVVRRGKVVHFHCHFSLLKQANDWNEYTLVNLPTQYRTSHEFNGERYVSYNGSSYLFQYFVRPSGLISLKIDNNAPVGVACTLDFTYFTN